MAHRDTTSTGVSKSEVSRTTGGFHAYIGSYIIERVQGCHDVWLS